MTEQLPVPKYTQEELDEAAQALANTTPEEYLEWLQVFKSADQQANLPEAGCSINGYYTAESGADFQVTIRSYDPETVLAKLVRFSQLAAGYGLKARTPKPLSSAPAAVLPPAAVTVAAALAPAPAQTAVQNPIVTKPAPVHVPVSTPQPDMTSVISMGVPAGESQGPFKVEKVMAALLKDGVTKKLTVVTVPGTFYNQYGAACYKEMCEMLGLSLDAFQIGVNYAPPATMEYIWVDKDKKRVYAAKPFAA